MNFTFIDIAKQCCDADEYLDMGYMCAKANMCYNTLRPIGDTLWFGIPYALNTTIDILFYFHAALLALVGISAFFLLKKILPTCIFLLALIFLLWPTFFFTLSDTPATLFFIEGIILTLIGVNRNSALLFFLAGISFGLSVLLRTAYFFPLLLASSVFSAYLLWQLIRQLTRPKQKLQWSVIFILSFIIPVSLQFFNTLKNTGHWHFLHEARNQSIMNLHLNSADAGYDTVLPQAGIFWSPGCAPDQGLLPSLQSANISSITCILKNRLTFYFGSYAPSTYLGENSRNFLDNDRSEKTVHAEKNDSRYFIEYKSLLPLPAGEYYYNVLLWTETKKMPVIASAEASNITISAASSTTPALLLTNPIRHKKLTITGDQRPYMFDIVNTSPGYIVIRISSTDMFISQRAALEPTKSAHGYFYQKTSNTVIGKNTEFASGNRIFSNIYFLINGLIIFMAFYYLLTRLVKTQTPALVFIAVLLLSTLMQCMLIIPEQRYIQAVLGSCWLMSILFFLDRRRNS